jgi:hypothetical protein
VNYYLKKKMRGEARIEVYSGSVLINAITGPAEAGLNSVQWYMTKRSRKRSPREAERVEVGLPSMEEEEDFYDYYDTVDFHLDPDDEVNVLGQSQHTRVSFGGPFDKEWAYQRVQPGRYTIKLIVGDETLTGNVDILQDHWYDKRL